MAKERGKRWKMILYTSAISPIYKKQGHVRIRCFIESVTSFFDKVRTCLVAGWTGGTFDTAENDLATGIDFFAMISVDAKVMCIVKTAFVIPVAEPVQPDFF